MHAAFDEIAGVDPIYMSVAERKAAMVETAKLRARADALDLLLLAAGDVHVDVDTGARSTAVWSADETRDAHGAVRNRATLAEALAARWTQVADALAAGVVNLAQPRAIVESLDALSDDLDADLSAKAEAFLVERAADLGPRELRNLGRALLQHLAPEIADEAELRRPEAEEARAAAVTRLSFRRRGDGATDIHARVADHVAGRARALVDAVANPRRASNDDDFMRLPVDRRRGIAFQSLLESVLESDLPTDGSTATSVVVTVAYETLVSGLGVASTSTGDTLSAEQARRMACTAQILPAVLGGKGEILDLGRGSRFFKGGSRKAMDLRDKECTTRGCHVPAAFCHAHRSTFNGADGWTVGHHVRPGVASSCGDGEMQMGDNTETAVLAGGCAWIMQMLLRHPAGVISTRAGFMGGKNDNPTEEDNLGHAEVVEVIFDPARLSYRGLLEVFFQVHRADLDEGVVGSQYRSEIFYTTPEQRSVAEEMVGDVDASGHWPGKTVTNISQASAFWEMGPEDQDYFVRFPHNCKPPFPHRQEHGVGLRS